MREGIWGPENSMSFTGATGVGAAEWGRKGPSLITLHLLVILKDTNLGKQAGTINPVMRLLLFPLSRCYSFSHFGCRDSSSRGRTQ